MKRFLAKINSNDELEAGFFSVLDPKWFFDCFGSLHTYRKKHVKYHPPLALSDSPNCGAGRGGGVNGDGFFLLFYPVKSNFAMVYFRLVFAIFWSCLEGWLSRGCHSAPKISDLVLNCVGDYLVLGIKHGFHVIIVLYN